MGKEEGFFEAESGTGTEAVVAERPHNLCSIYPHAITAEGKECTIHEAVLYGQEIVGICEIDGTKHERTTEDDALIEAEIQECGA